MIHQVREVISLESRLFLLIFGEILPQNEPVKDVVALALCVQTFLDQGCQLHVVFKLIITTVMVHEGKRVVEGLIPAVLVACCVHIFAQATKKVAEPHASEECRKYHQLALDSEDAELSEQVQCEPIFKN